MRAEYENVLDDHLGKIHFTYVNTWDELLPAHWHEHLEIIYVLGGEITASINDVSYELKKGDIFLVNSNDIHYTYTHEDPGIIFYRSRRFIWKEFLQSGRD